MVDSPLEDTLTLPTEVETTQLSVVREANDVASRFLPEIHRERMQSAIDRYEAALAVRQEWSERLREAQARVGEHTGPPTPELRTLMEVQRDAPADPEPLREAAEKARVALREDDDARAPYEELLEEAREISKRLHTSVEDRIRDVLLAGQVPYWLRTALGVRPPSASSAEQWLAAAVRLVLFRFLHQVQDPILPCGRTSELSPSVARAAQEILSECDKFAT